MSRKRQRLDKTIQTGHIVSFSHDGRGIARMNGKATFIQGALPGETVLFQYSRRKTDFDEGHVTEVLEPSPYRVMPRCKHYVMCGGCSLQHLEEPRQITEKQDMLLDLLRRVGHVAPQNLLPPLSGNHWHYRHKARLSVRYVEKKQSCLVGFREKKNPRYIAEIEQCPVLHSKLDRHIIDLRRLVDSLDSLSAIAQIEVAAGDEEVALIFRNLEPLSVTDQEKIRQFAEDLQFKIFLQPGGADSVTLFYPEQADEFLYYELPAQKVRFQFHPTDFTQVNSGLNRLMVDRALELMDLNEQDVVLDLFCGLGNFSLPMARVCAHVTGIEGSDKMVLRASENARLNNIDNAEFYCANLDEINSLEKIVNFQFTKVLIDPPRSGALEIVRQIDTLKPIRIVYVSCNPATLARDTDILVNHHGYRLTSVGVMDMFPHTTHVESIALFEKDRQ
ncbi:23S rRNA (uracil(1939)-C(5))-methyltransferase RlmD [Legionella spiritensis]|uniref:23S rRNA (uracil(1939)-C(5))-methyltransferase RlmD n=1 Tax=Legionella spiritensis TaxID=452 RepID=A0A0W0Z4F2_LEGSP|nr:23S rRNA (uracil(1939)-C(5))-methyltransferase RlmD [Legionella spiritensis]KTD64002.1 23S rRNA (uracil-5-)-methyltransferase RumA [Legionella spiritensis]SNV37101.1 23S rRNA (uracil-5-)-methyltransferase RumA [Legionella spiritensis]